MQLQVRQGDDRYFSGYKELEKRVSKFEPKEISILLYYAFDWRTRIGPFVGPDLSLANAGVRDVAGALYSAGLNNVRVVFGNWNPKFNFRFAKLHGKTPEVFGIGSLQVNSADANSKIKQAVSLGKDRPLILGGGPHAVYQPWKYFNIDGDPAIGVDVAVRGEQPVTLSLMEVLLTYRSIKGTMREAFNEARRDKALNSIPGLMYISEDRSHLIDTGVPRMMSNYDDLPLEIIGLGLLEERGKHKGLNDGPIPLDKLSKKGLKIISTLMSRGCNLRCSFCPIPNQQQYALRSKSSQRLIEDIEKILKQTGINTFFGTDDNAAFSRENLENQYGAMARAGLGRKIFYGTEATEGQIWASRDLIPTLREAGVRAIWFGIEDLTADLVKKGQSPEKTKNLFGLLKQNDIHPMPMMIHYDGQPLNGPNGKLLGILDQVKFLRDNGASTIQVMYLGPSTGSKDEDSLYSSGKVFRQVGGVKIEDRHFDGCHVIATAEENPIERQENLLRAYQYFYNSSNLLQGLWRGIRNKDLLKDFSPVWLQLYGLNLLRISRKNLAPYKSALASGTFKRYSEIPTCTLPIVQANQ